MVIKKRILKQVVDKEEVISRGGHVAADLPSKKIKMTYLLTMPIHINAQIVEKINKRIGVSKNTWILEAIYEKLGVDE